MGQLQTDGISAIDDGLHNTVNDTACRQLTEMRSPTLNWRSSGFFWAGTSGIYHSAPAGSCHDLGNMGRSGGWAESVKHRNGRFLYHNAN
jgi:hypothetical protein